jgi:hypothetical protein
MIDRGRHSPRPNPSTTWIPTATQIDLEGNSNCTRESRRTPVLFEQYVVGHGRATGRLVDRRWRAYDADRTPRGKLWTLDDRSIAVQCLVDCSCHCCACFNMGVPEPVVCVDRPGLDDDEWTGRRCVVSGQTSKQSLAPGSSVAPSDMQRFKPN